MEGIEVQGKTVEEAIENGLEQLGITREEAEVEVLEEPANKGLLFKKATLAKVKIGKKPTDSQRAVKFLEEVFRLSDIRATAEIVRDDDKIGINLIATDSSALIGFRGEMLDALQCLAGAVANIGRKEYKRVMVDCEGYREKREETLKNLAQRLADKAVKMGRKVVLEPMSPFERRIIHTALVDNKEVETLSEGKEPERHIVIVPGVITDERPFMADRSRRPSERKFDDGRRHETRKYEGRRGGPGRSSGYSRDRRERDPENAMYGKPKDKHNVTSYGTFIGNSHDD